MVKKNPNEKVRKWRMAAKLTQEQVANLIGTTRSNVAQIETGRIRIGIPFAKHYAKHMRCNLEDLLV